METTKNKFIAVAYELFAEDETGRHIVEKATADKPFTFISGFGIVLSDFEAALVGLDNGAEFDFTLTPEQAYGNYEEERVLELDRECSASTAASIMSTSASTPSCRCRIRRATALWPACSTFATRRLSWT